MKIILISTQYYSVACKTNLKNLPIHVTTSDSLIKFKVSLFPK